MKFLHLFYLKYGDKSIDVIKSIHVNVSRGNTKFVRDMFIDDERYKQILQQAIIHGLTSFRNKGQVVINFKDSYGLAYGLIVEIDDTSIKIITVFNSKKYLFWTFFIKIQNRINLWNFYTMQVMNKEQFKAKKLNSNKIDININCKKEDNDFLKYLSYNNIKPIKEKK